MPRVQNETSGKFIKTYTDKDMEMFKDWVKSGTTYTGFTQNVMKLFPSISAATANNWWYKTKQELSKKEGKSK